MKRLLLTIAAILAGATAVIFFVIPPRDQRAPDSPYNCTGASKDKKRILIFSSKGGGGHISAMKALEQYLSDDFCVGHAFIFSDVLRTLDLATRSGEEWYNFLIKRKLYQVTKLAYNIGSWYYTFRERAVVKILEKYLTEHRPDLIISVIPLVNNAILKAAKNLDIPFLLIPTDLDATIATLGISKPTYEKFYLGLSYKKNDILESFKTARIDSKDIHYVGFPVKQEFFEPSSNRAIKKEFGIPENKPVVLLLMGAQGSNELYEFARQLSKLPIPAHIIIALGKSEYLKKSLQHIHFPKHISTTMLGFTDRMPDLMKIADLFISKSGSVSVNEAIYAQIPILLDGTSSVLKWEQFNHNFIVKNVLGQVIKRYSHIPYMVTDILTNQEYRTSIKKNLATFEKNNPEQEIKLLVKKILAN